VNIVVIVVKLIVSKFVLHPQKDEYSTSHTDSEAKQIGQREPFVAKQVSPGNLDIVIEHKKLLIFTC
jgi:hypothetical protein